MLLTKLNVPTEFCSIDASTTSMAYAYYKDTELSDYGKVSFSGSNIHEKIRDMAFKVKEFFNEHPTSHLAIEATVLVNSPKTMQQLSLSQGGLLASAALGGVREVRTVPPITWQSYINNKKLTTIEKQRIKTEYPGKSLTWYKGQERKVRKQKTIDFVNMKYGIELDDDDIADAVAIGFYTTHNWSRMQT